MFDKFEKKEENLLAYIKSYSQEENTITNFANLSALLNYYFEDINWIGFYLVENDNLILGPFQGLPACTIIPFGKGVCGTCAKTLEIQIIKNVHELENHITCDANSTSEIVLPIFKNNKLFAILDVDSPLENRFAKDVELFKQIIFEIERGLNHESHEL